MSRYYLLPLGRDVWYSRLYSVRRTVTSCRVGTGHPSEIGASHWYCERHYFGGLEGKPLAFQPESQKLGPVVQVQINTHGPPLKPNTPTAAPRSLP